MTKALTALSGADKEYEAAFAFGAETDTLDATGEVVRESLAFPKGLQEIAAAAASFVGRPYAQKPPAHSAVRVGGRRAYDLARAGAHPDLPARAVRMSACAVLSYEPPVAILRMRVSKGFYVRAFARDLAAKLGSAATAVAIVRTRVAGHSLDGAVSLSDLVGGRAEDAR